MTDFTPGPIITRLNPLWDGDRPSWLRDDVRVQWNDERDGWWGECGLAWHTHEVSWCCCDKFRLDASDPVYACIRWNEAHPDEAPWFPWYGGDAAPEDWDENSVLIGDDGVYEMRSGYRFNWAAKPENGYGVKLARIIGYRKRRPAASLPEPAEEEPSRAEKDALDRLIAYSAVEKAEHYAALADMVVVPKMTESDLRAWLAEWDDEEDDYEVSLVWGLKRLGILRPDPTPLDIAKAEYPEIPAEDIKRIAAIVKGEVNV